MTSKRDKKEFDDNLNFDNPQYYHIYLQLYKYDFQLFKESKVEGYKMTHVEGN